MAPFNPDAIVLPKLAPRAKARLDRLSFRKPGDKSAQTRAEHLEEEIAKLESEENELKQNLEQRRNTYLSRTEIEDVERNFLHIKFKFQGMNERTQKLCDGVSEQIDSTKRALVQALAPRTVTDLDSRRASRKLKKSSKELSRRRRDLKLYALRLALVDDEIKELEEQRDSVKRAVEGLPRRTDEINNESDKSDASIVVSSDSESDSESEAEEPGDEPKVVVEEEVKTTEATKPAAIGISEETSFEIVETSGVDLMGDDGGDSQPPQNSEPASPTDHAQNPPDEEDARSNHSQTTQDTEKEDFRSLKDKNVIPAEALVTGIDSGKRAADGTSGAEVEGLGEGDDKQLGTDSAKNSQAYEVPVDAGQSQLKSDEKKGVDRKAQKKEDMKRAKRLERVKAKREERLKRNLSDMNELNGELKRFEEECDQKESERRRLVTAHDQVKKQVESLERQTRDLAQAEKEKGIQNAENEYDHRWLVKKREDQKLEIQDLERQRDREEALESARRDLARPSNRARQKMVLWRRLRWDDPYYYGTSSDSDADEPENSEKSQMQSLRKVIDGVEALEVKIREVRRLSEEVDSKTDLRIVLERELDLERRWLNTIDKQSTASASTEDMNIAPPELRDHFSASISPDDLKFYKTLQPDQVRLLIVWPAPDDYYPLLCSLDTATFGQGSSVPEYAALSYNWGDDVCNGRLYLVLQEGPANSTEPSAWGSTARYARRIPIRNNLFRALLRLRRVDKPVSLWVDFVCINQTNLVEKTEQLEQLINIYRNAKNVCIWLGEGDNDGRSDEAMDFITSIMDFAVLDRYAKDTKQAKKWHYLAELMRDKWFSRRWVVQEVSLARKATVHCGGKMVQWPDFADAVSLLASNQETIQKLFDYKEWRDGPKTLGDVQSFGAYILLEATSKLFLRTAQGDITRPVKKLEALVTSLKTFDATDQKDLIYSLVSIACDTPQSRNIYGMGGGTAELEVDYAKDTISVYKDFTKFCIVSSNSLDVLCRPWAMPITTPRTPLPAPLAPKLPSWIPLLARSEFGTPDEVYSGRKNGENLVGPVDRPHYKASGEASKYNVAELLANKHLSDQNILPLAGFKLARVTNVSPRNTGGVILRESLKMGGWGHIGQDTSNVPDQIWRTLVADKDPDGQIPPSWYQRACLRCLEIADTFNNGDLNIGELLQGNSDLIRKYLTRVKNVTWNRRFFQASMDRNKATSKSFHESENASSKRPNVSVDMEESNYPASTTGLATPVPEQEPVDSTNHDKNQNPSHERRLSTANGLVKFHEIPPPTQSRDQTDDDQQRAPLFGLGPPTMEEGDFVCILRGCSVPIILRQIPASMPSQQRQQDRHMLFIGEAYVHGKMEGEAVEDLTRKQALGRNWEVYKVE